MARLWENLIDPNGRNGRWTHAILTAVFVTVSYTVANAWPRSQGGVWGEVSAAIASCLLLGSAYLGIVNAVRRLNDLGLSGYLAPLGMVPFVNFAYYAFVLFAPSRRNACRNARWDRRLREHVAALKKDFAPSSVSFSRPEDGPCVVRVTYTVEGLERLLDREAAFEYQHPFSELNPRLWVCLLIRNEDLRPWRDPIYLRRIAAGWWQQLDEAAVLEIADDRGTVHRVIGQLPLFLR